MAKGRRTGQAAARAAGGSIEAGGRGGPGAGIEPDAAAGRGATGRDEAVRRARTVGFAVILTEAEYDDLAQRHAVFRHRGYPHYLATVAGRIAAAHRAGRHVLVGPLLPDQYEGFADMLGLAADTPQAVQAYNDFVARLGSHTVQWTGQPLPRLLTAWRASVGEPQRRGGRERPGARGGAEGMSLGRTGPAPTAQPGPTRESGHARIVPLLRAAADRHRDPHATAATAIDRAMRLFSRLSAQARDGDHTLVCSMALPDGPGSDGRRGDPVVHRLAFTRRGTRVSFPEHGPEYLLWAMFALADMSGLTVEILLFSSQQVKAARTVAVRGWQLSGSAVRPLAVGRVRAAVTARGRGGLVPAGHTARFESAGALDPDPP